MPDIVGFDDGVAAELLAKTRALLPRILAEAVNAEAQGRLSQETVALLEEAGLFRIAASRRVGGLSGSTTTLANVAALLAKSCPSTAWLVVISNSNSLQSSLAPEATLDEVFTKGVPIVTGAANPSGSSRKVDGGYLVTGKWPYSSCCYHADWCLLNVGANGPNGRTVSEATAYVPATQVSIEDTWRVSGLKATGSSTMVVTELFVPDSRYVTNPQAREAQIKHQQQGDAPDFLALFPHGRASLLGVLVGASEAVLELVVSGASSRSIAFTTHARQSDSSVVQREIGEAAAKIAFARLAMLEVAKMVDHSASERRAMEPLEQSRSRALTCHAVETLVKAVDKLMFVGGSSAFAEKSPLQRYWRDLNIAARHALNLPTVGYEIYGQTLLGITPTVAIDESAI